MVNYVDAILYIKTSISATSDEAKRTFGEGGYTLEEQKEMNLQVENFVGKINTPTLNGYIKVRIPEYFGQALEFIDANGGSANADLIRVEWPLTEDQPPYEPFMVEVDDYDINGKVIGKRLQEVGGF